MMREIGEAAALVMSDLIELGAGATAGELEAMAAIAVSAASAIETLIGARRFSQNVKLHRAALLVADHRAAKAARQ